MNSGNNFMDMVTDYVTFREGVPIIEEEHNFPLTLSQQLLKAVMERPEDYEDAFDDLINEFGSEKVYTELYMNLRGEDMNFVNGVLSVTESGALRLSNYVHNLIKEHCKSRKEIADSFQWDDDEELFDLDDEVVEKDEDEELADMYEDEQLINMDDEVIEMEEDEDLINMDDEVIEMDEDEDLIDMDDEVIELDGELFNLDED